MKRRPYIQMLLGSAMVGLLALLLMNACSVTPGAPTEAKPQPQTTEAQGTPILDYFAQDEAVAKLREDMEAGRVPVECNVLYDQMGSLPEIVVIDSESIEELYVRLSQMRVLEPSNESITDCYHHIYFTLQDGTRVGWSFEGTGLLSQGRENLAVSDEGELWQLVRDLQDAYLESMEGLESN